MTKRIFGIVVFLTLSLVFGQTANAQGGKVSFYQKNGKVIFSIGGEQAGTYITQGVSKPIIFPAYAPGKIPVTRSFPMIKEVPGESKDHPHQQSIWFCHGDVIPKGMEIRKKVLLKSGSGVDFWSLAPNHGNIVCTDVKIGKSGSYWASIDTTNEWKTSDDIKIMDEKRTVTLYDFGKAWLWVFNIDLHASVSPIVFGDTKEGSMAIRVNDKMNEKGTGTLQNAEGKKKEKECWGQKSAWCDYSGTVDGKKVGIAILDDPKNPPSCWHARGYGLLGANPFGRKKAAFPGAKDKMDLIELAQGSHLVLRYGVLIHEGGTEDGNVAEYYQRFVKLGGKGN